MATPNFASGSVWVGDNLPILRGMNDACVDLIYLDPPFNSGRTYEALAGSKATGASFKDAWSMSDSDISEHRELADQSPLAYAVTNLAGQTHSEAMQSYLIFMAVRLIELRRILQSTGSIYLHCDPTASHYLKALMDSLFGRQHFRNEIAWCYTGPGKTKRWFPRKHDTILFYAAGSAAGFNRDKIRIPYLRLNTQSSTSIMGAAMSESERAAYLEKGKVPEDWWADIGAGGHIPNPEHIGYPTQKPLALLERIVKASSNPGDMILDPFCGCATTLVAADRHQRQWAGIDISPQAVKLANERITADRGSLPWGGAIARTEPPVRGQKGLI